jgi:hypothetical protein
LPTLPREHDSSTWYAAFSEQWSARPVHSGENCGPSALWRVLAALFRKPTIVSGALEVADIALTFAMVAILTTVVDFLTGDAHTVVVAVVAAVSLFVREPPAECSHVGMLLLLECACVSR